MKYFIINRFAPTEDGTLGCMGPRWFTFEEEDQENKPNISSIATGAYICRRIRSPKFGNTFEITDVPGRSHVLFHSLNTEEDTEGCIGLGTEVGFLERVDEDSGKKMRKLAILNSKTAHREFMAELAGVDKFILVVQNYR